VKAVKFAMITSVVLLGSACSLWPEAEPEKPVIDFLILPTSAFQNDVRSVQQREVSTGARKAAARDAYENLKKDFKEADEKTRPALSVQLATAQSDYINAQEQHIAAKRSLRQANDAYLRKLYLNKHPELAAGQALDVTAEAGLPATATAPAATGIPPVEIISKPQTPAEDGAVEAGSDDRFIK